MDSPIDAELQRLNANIPLPKKRTSFPPAGVGGEGVPVNFRDWPDAWTELRRLEGNELKHPAYGLGAKELLDKVVKGEHPLSAIYKLKPDGDGPGSKGEWIRGILHDYRVLAARKIMNDPEYDGRFGEFRAFIHDQQAAAQANKMEALGVQ